MSTKAARSLDLAVIPGDCVGPEVMAEATKVLATAADLHGVRLRTTAYDLGASRYLATGEVLPDSVLDELRGHDAILLGAVGHPDVTPGVLERGLMLKMRFGLDHAVNLRPAHLHRSEDSPLRDPGPIDLVVVREGTEGPYSGSGGVHRMGTDHELALEISVNTAHGVRRVVRDAFARADRRRRRLTLVHKRNVLVHAGPLWDRCVAETSLEFPEVEVDYVHTDAATIYLVTDPGRFDVVVTDNLFGDIITDLAGAVTGGIGLAASGSINTDGTAPSMFEPVHGSAPDIAGRAIADPTAAVLSAAMMLEHLGETVVADAVRAAVNADLATRARPRRTEEVGDAIASLLVRTAERDRSEDR